MLIILVDSSIIVLRLISELCPKQYDTRNLFFKNSHVDDFEGVPELFNAFAADENDWNVYTFQLDFDKVLSGSKLHNFRMENNDKHLDGAIKERDSFGTVNCTVIYLDQCTSWSKCRQSCQTTGASGYR